MLDYTVPTPTIEQLDTAAELPVSHAIFELGLFITGTCARLDADGHLYRLCVEVTDCEGWRGQRLYLIEPDGSWASAQHTHTPTCGHV